MERALLLFLPAACLVAPEAQAPSAKGGRSWSRWCLHSVGAVMLPSSLTVSGFSSKVGLSFHYFPVRSAREGESHSWGSASCFQGLYLAVHSLPSALVCSVVSSIMCGPVVQFPEERLPSK